MITKAQMIEAIQSLPEDATVKDAIERLEFIELIESRIAGADAGGRKITQEEMRRQIAQWRT